MIKIISITNWHGLTESYGDIAEFMQFILYLAKHSEFQHTIKFEHDGKVCEVHV